MPNEPAMTFDAGTWWVVGLTITVLIGAVGLFLKKYVLGRIDKCEEKVGECITKAEHEKARKELSDDIKHIKEDYITKEDFFREQSKTDRKLDRIMDILLEMKGGKSNDR